MTRWRAVGEEDGAAHTDFGITRLAPGGRTAPHVHSFEESFPVVVGEVNHATPEATERLVAGADGGLPSGVPHELRSMGAASAAWADLSPPPSRARRGHEPDRVPEP